MNALEFVRSRRLRHFRICALGSSRESAISVSSQGSLLFETIVAPNHTELTTLTQNATRLCNASFRRHVQRCRYCRQCHADAAARPHATSDSMFMRLLLSKHLQQSSVRLILLMHVCNVILELLMNFEHTATFAASSLQRLFYDLACGIVVLYNNVSLL